MITRMFPRILQARIEELLAQFPAVAMLGPRQVGKTTLALEIAGKSDALYLDLEHPADLTKLSDPADYLSRHKDKLVILDEIHRVPELFPVLRSLIDEGRRAGQRSGRYLLLGSASIDLLRQSSESLAGRLATVELAGLTVAEVGTDRIDELWLRGGFPDSLTAPNDKQSGHWREEFLRSYLERDIPQLGPRIAAETLRRFWTMLAHEHGGLLNAAQLARSLAVSGKTLASYVDLFLDLFLLRRLEPWHANTTKRLVKSPRVYLRDSGLLHHLLGIRSMEELLGYSRMGASWEGFAIENIIADYLPEDAEPIPATGSLTGDLSVEIADKKLVAVVAQPAPEGGRLDDVGGVEIGECGLAGLPAPERAGSPQFFHLLEARSPLQEFCLGGL